ncbi:MAG TPA: Hint domain-containing homing endonuclease, partial [Candidatus Acidoferrales bacterium]|nr:Hint domain-containing homing endonuclease [Candidatus Acidoferrales bacterium]
GVAPHWLRDYKSFNEMNPEEGDNFLRMLVERGDVKPEELDSWRYEELFGKDHPTRPSARKMLDAQWEKEKKQKKTKPKKGGDGGGGGSTPPRMEPPPALKPSEKIEPSSKLEQQALTPEERKDLTLKAQGGILPLDTGAVRSKVFPHLAKATEWAKANKEKIKGLQIFQLKDGRAVADFTAKQANVLFQSDYEREREIAFANVKIGMLQDKLRHVMSDAQRAEINRQIRDLRTKREAVKSVGMEAPPGEVVKLWTPEGERPVEVKREPKAETRPARTVPDEPIRLSEPPGPRGVSERPRTSGVTEPKPSSGGGVRTTGARPGERANIGEPRSSLRDVRPLSVAPVRPRGEPAYSKPDWDSRVEKFRLPANAPAPTMQISDNLARMLMPGQREVVESVLSGLQQHDGYILATTTGTGKCLATGTPVLMFDGTIKKVEDVCVGDLLMGPDSKPRVVLSLASGEDNMYRVTPTKGDPYEVNEPHILSLKMTRRWSKHKWGRDGKTVNISVLDYLKQSRFWKHCAKGYRTGVEFQYKETPLPAYFLGTWLGDGNAHDVGVTTIDPAIISYWHAMADWFGLDMRVDQSEDRCPTYVLTSHQRGQKNNKIYELLKGMGLLRNKHIPPAYKANSRRNRLELLAGLMDTDGSLSGGCYDFISKWETLANDVAFVARSLGFAAYVKPCNKTCKNNGKVGRYYRVSISGDVSEIPVRIKYKEAKPRRQKKDVLVTGIKVTPIGRGQYFGFEISGDGLFLLGDFTVTHNTFMGSAVIADLQSRKPDARMLILTPSQSLVHGRDGWIQVAGNFGIEVKPLPVGEIPEEPGVYIKTWAGGIANRDIENVPWDLVIMDEVQEARKWWTSQRGDMSKTMADNAKKIIYTSATPFHTALEIGHMGKLGLWGREGYERWAAENGLGVYRDKAGNLAGGKAPLRLEKLRQQLIERGQMINIDRNMDGYSAHFGVVPMDGMTAQGLKNIDQALQLAENYFARSGKKGMIQATKAQRTTLAKRWLEYQRLPQAIELAKKLEKEGWKVIFFSENKKEFTELFDFLQPADAAMGGRISQLMPKFKNTTEVLRDAFGEDVAVFAGKHSAEREGEKDAFNDDDKSHLYATYGAGGVGVSMHDKAGDKPRAVIYLGPPWSGISFDQALGRPWRYGTKSNVRAYFLFSDSQAEMDLVTNKVAPRMESLRAMVSGVNFNDPVVKNLRSVPENRAGALDYDHGNAHEADFNQFTKKRETSGVSSYAELPVVSAEEAKNK